MKNRDGDNGRNNRIVDTPTYNRMPPESASSEATGDQDISKRITIPGELMSVAVIIMCLMVLYEVVKQMIYPGISIWESHAVTILFTTVMATVVTYFIVRRYESYIITVSEEKLRREQSEQALRESKRTYRLIFETTGAAIVITDNDMNVIDVDDLFLMISGYSRNDFHQNIKLNDLIVSDDNETMMQYYRLKADKTDSSPSLCELHLAMKDGNIRTVMLAAALIPGAHRYVTAILDITEQKKVNEDLRKSEEQLRTFLNSTSDMAFIKDDKYRYVFVNKSIADFFDTSVGEMIGNTDFHFMETLMAEKFRSNDEKTLALHTILVDDETIGNKVFEITRFPVPAGDNGIGIGGYIRDISRRRKAESDLIQSEEKYRTTLETIEEGYYEVDLAGNFIFFNKSLCDLSGYTREELMGKNSREYASPEMAQKLYRTFNTVYKSGIAVKNAEFEIIRKDGTKKNVELSVSLKQDTDGSAAAFRGMARDVTDRTKAQEERKKLERQLRQARKMEAVGTLAAGVAHNFNNILMGIQGNASLMLLQDTHNERGSKRLGEIEKLVQRGSLLTSQVLGYAREGKYEVKPVDINKILQETAHTFGMTRKEIRVHYECADDITSVLADQDQIEQVFMNIYINAAEAMQQGGDLYIKTMNVTHEYMTDRVYDPEPGRYVLVSITDTGEGMTKKTMNRIFDPFFTSKGLGTGKGMSLASAYGVVKAHQGYIDVFSKRKQGTRFEIFLPVANVETSAEMSVSDQLVHGEETILLVDDEEMILDIGWQMLDALGYDVLTAGSGLEAVEMYRNNQDDIDMVVLDMIMPGMSGGDVYDMLKAMKQDVKVLLASGYSVDGQATEILERGCDGFIQKPFDMRRLSKAIRKVLRGAGEKSTEYL